MADANIALAVVWLLVAASWAVLWLTAPTPTFWMSGALSFAGAVLMLAGQAIKVWWPT
jgi:hypothetical protein